MCTLKSSKTKLCAYSFKQTLIFILSLFPQYLTALTHCAVGQTAAIIECYIFVWSYKGSKTDSQNVVKLVVSFFTVLKINFKSTHFGPLPENG